MHKVYLSARYPLSYAVAHWNEKIINEMDTFCKLPKIEKTIAYGFNKVLLNWNITKQGLRGFWVNPLSSRMVFGVHNIMVFSNVV